MFASRDLRCDDMLYDDVVNEQGSALGVEMFRIIFRINFSI